MNKICKKCNLSKDLDKNFRTVLGRDKKTYYYKNICLECEKLASKIWGRNNKEHRRKYTRKFLKENVGYVKQWKIANKEHVSKYNYEYEQRVHIKLKKRVSQAIRNGLKRMGGKKNAFHFTNFTLFN